MAEILTIRETVEYDVEVPTDPDENPHFHGGLSDAINLRSVAREVLRRRHVPDYVIGMDMVRRVYWLTADGVEVFAHRSNDAVYEHYKELAGQPDFAYFRFDDVEDPDKSWRLLD